MTDEERWRARRDLLWRRTWRASDLLLFKMSDDHREMERMHAEAIAILEGRRDPRDGG